MACKGLESRRCIGHELMQAALQVGYLSSRPAPLNLGSPIDAAGPCSRRCAVPWQGKGLHAQWTEASGARPYAALGTRACPTGWLAIRLAYTSAVQPARPCSQLRLPHRLRHRLVHHLAQLLEQSLMHRSSQVLLEDCASEGHNRGSD